MDDLLAQKEYFYSITNDEFKENKKTKGRHRGSNV